MNPQIPYNEIESLPHNKTVSYVNNFIIHTTQFLNRFSYLCEEKLAAVSRNIQRLEITMSILEAKLNSIPELDDITGPEHSTTTESTATGGGEVTDVPEGDSGEDTGVPEEYPDIPESDYYADHTAEKEAISPDVMTVSQDPRYGTYFKMLKLKVPISAIKQKMMIEGIDPNILDDPDAPSDGAVADVTPGGELRDLSESSSEYEYSE